MLAGTPPASKEAAELCERALAHAADWPAGGVWIATVHERRARCELAPGGGGGGAAMAELDAAEAAAGGVPEVWAGRGQLLADRRQYPEAAAALATAIAQHEEAGRLASEKGSAGSPALLRAADARRLLLRVERCAAVGPSTHCRGRSPADQ